MGVRRAHVCVVGVDMGVEMDQCHRPMPLVDRSQQREDVWSPPKVMIRPCDNSSAAASIVAMASSITYVLQGMSPASTTCWDPNG